MKHVNKFEIYLTKVMLLVKLQCSDLATSYGKKGTVHKLFRNQEDTFIHSLRKTIGKSRVFIYLTQKKKLIISSDVTI